MKKDNKDLYNKIMEQVAKQVKQSLNEVDDIAPKKQEVVGEVYLVRCDGMNKSVLDKLSSKLPAFDNYGAGSVRITCKTHEEVVNVITLLVNANVLDVDNSLGQSPKIAIQKVNKNSVNDSVNESDTAKQAQTRKYISPNKMFSPRQEIKLNIIERILSGELERTPDAIRNEIVASGLWNTSKRAESRIEMDVNLIMRKTDPTRDDMDLIMGKTNQDDKEKIEGDFITDFVYSPYNYDAGEFASPMDAAENHVKWLTKHGLNIRIEEGRYSYKYYIHYSSKQQYKDLIQWMAWHCGFTDRVNNPLSKKDYEYFENIVKSGKKTTFR